MKSLQITLMMAVFCLTISGTSNTSETAITKETIQKIDMTDYKFMADAVKKNVKRPPVS